MQCGATHTRQRPCLRAAATAALFLAAVVWGTDVTAGDWGLAPRLFQETLVVSQQGYLVRTSIRHASRRDRRDYEAEFGPDGVYCGYPKISDVEPYAVSLRACTAGNSCQEWELYRKVGGAKDCTKPASAAATLKAAAKEMAKLSLAMPGATAHEPVLDLEGLKAALATWDVAGTVVAGKIRSGPICGLQLQAEDVRITLMSETAANEFASCGGYQLRGIRLDGPRSLAVFVVDNYLRQRTIAWKSKDIAARVLNARGFQRHKAKDYISSERLFARALGLDPHFGQAAFNLACAQSLQGKSREALESLATAIRANPNRFVRKAKKDHDLDSLRNKASFKELVDR